MTITWTPAFAARIQDIVHASPWPLDAAAIRRQLAGSEFAVKPKALPDLAALLPTVPGLAVWHPASAKAGPRYWNRTTEAVAETTALAAASNAPVASARIITAITKGRTGLPRDKATALVDQLEQAGKLHRRPLLAQSKYKLTSRLTDDDRAYLEWAYAVIQRTLHGTAIPQPVRKDDAMILEALERIEPRKGLVVTAHRLRAALPEFSKVELDDAVLRLYRTEKVLLHRHSGPYLLPVAERAELIQSGADFYVGVCINIGEPQ